MMTLRQVEFFLAVYESGSFSKAAQVLYVSQQTVSKAIRQLEAELRHELFVRSTEGVSPNEYGEAVHEELASIQETIDRLPRRLAGVSGARRERVRAIVAFGVIGSLARSIFIDFAKAHSSIDLDIRDAPDLDVEDAVLCGDADLGIGVGPADTELFDAVLLKRERYYLLVHDEHPLWDSEEVTMDDLRGCRFVNMSDRFKAYYNLTRCCKSYGFEPDVVYTSNEIITIIEMAENNMGLAPIPTSKAYSRSEHVRFIPFPDDFFNYSLYLMKRKDDQLSRGASELADHVVELYRGSCKELV